MLEAQQLLIEDAVAALLGRTALAVGRAASSIRKKLAFWQLPSRELLVPAGIWRPDDVHSNAFAAASYRDLTALLFHEDYRDRDQGADIEGGSDDAVELASQNFVAFRRYGSRPQQLDQGRVYCGQSLDPHGFISDYIAGPVLIGGRRCFICSIRRSRDNIHHAHSAPG